jgi:hypothetical protein
VPRAPASRGARRVWAPCTMSAASRSMP